MVLINEDDIGLTEDDPIKFCQAMKSSNSQKWIDVMEDEIKSVRDNNVWDLVELLEGVKPIVVNGYLNLKGFYG